MKKYILILAFLSLTFCEKKNDFFEIKGFNVNTEYKSKHILKSPIGKVLTEFNGETYNPKTVRGARFLNLNLDLKNNSGEKINFAELRPFIRLEYERSFKTISLKNSEFIMKNTIKWNSNNTKNINLKFLLNNAIDYDSDIFEYEPKKVTLELYITANNSVGFGVNDEKILTREITEKWFIDK